MKAFVRLLFLALVSAVHKPAHAQSEPSHRIAVVVGANAAAPGRRSLRYAHTDAKDVARVLREVGGFEASNVHVLLDPYPKELLDVLDRSLSALSGTPSDSMLVFYYSGHADAQALYPHGESLKFLDLRHRLENEAASVRVGIVDTCRGGGWTGARGLSETDTFEVNIPLELSNEGSVLIASSSGLEDAHESDELEGGFFTHHWNAALRGAADRNGDHTVTLTEAFEYAQRLTIRDTAQRVNLPQHPSFQMNLRGRHDLPLVRLASSATLLSIEEQQGPLQLVHLDTGLIVLEIPEGRRTLRLAVPPGHYLVRTSSGRRTRAREVVIRPGKPRAIREVDLDVMGDARLVSRGFWSRPVTATTVQDGTRSPFSAQLSAGAAKDLSHEDAAALGGWMMGMQVGYTAQATKFYVGLQVRYLDGESYRFQALDATGSSDVGRFSAHSVLMGGRIGYDAEIAPWFVLRPTFGLGAAILWRNVSVPPGFEAPIDVAKKGTDGAMYLSMALTPVFTFQRFLVFMDAGVDWIASRRIEGNMALTFGGGAGIRF